MNGYRGPARLRIGAIDDHPAILHGVSSGLRTIFRNPPLLVVAETVSQLLATKEQLDVVLLDLSLADGSVPAENVGTLVQHGYEVLVFTQEARPRPVATALRAGAKGVVSKSQTIEELAEAIVAVARGEAHLSQEWAAALESDAERIAPHLSIREREALQLYAAGLPLKSVARQMNVGMDTVRVYLLRVRAKYEHSGRPAVTKTDLYIRAVEDGYLPPPAVD